jgi:hypothetical protein
MGKLTDSYNLQKINPTLSKQWHPNKNGNLTPKDVTPSINRKVWWICNRGHEWVAKISSRTHGTGCPFCAGRSVCRDNCLQTKNPELSKEWHPTKNGHLTSRDITPGSGHKSWWQCRKGHEWQALVKSRVKGADCPFCSGRYVSKENNLQVIYPELSEEWHSMKNGNLTPNDVLPYSNSRVWWKCQKGHEWETRVLNRTKNKNSCPYCAGRVASENRNLKVLNPKLAGQWHPTKNGDLTPKDILPGAHKRVWWQCDKGHDWKAYVFSRNKGSGCRQCNRQKRLAT